MLQPWLDSIAQPLNRARLSGRLPHALLFTGMPGVGKMAVAEWLASALLCAAPDGQGQPCGKCAGCGWLQAGTHPDLFQLQPEEQGKSIKVDEIRSLCGSLAMTSHAGGYKVAIIHPAEAMNVNAANSLLKTLEEPAERTLIILLSALPGRLPATIRSRCQRITVLPPDPDQAVAWLQSMGVNTELALQCLGQARGAPLQALELAQDERWQLGERALSQLQQVFAGRLDPLRLAADWAGDPAQSALERWRTWLESAVRQKLAGGAVSAATGNPELQQIVETVDCRVLIELFDRVVNALNSLGSGLNRQLVLEDLLISWAEQSSRDSRRPRTTGG